VFRHGSGERGYLDVPPCLATTCSSTYRPWHATAARCWRTTRTLCSTGAQRPSSWPSPTKRLLNRCLHGVESATEETGRLPRTLDEDTVAGLRLLAERNQPAFTLLRQGVRCGRVQFPDFADDGGSLDEHAESLSPLRDLAHAWWALARLQIADGHYAAAATELAGLGDLGHMLCCGKAS